MAETITLGRVKLAEMLDISPTMVDQLVAEGQLPQPRKQRSRVLWLRSEVEAAVEDWPLRDQPKPEPQDDWNIQ